MTANKTFRQLRKQLRRRLKRFKRREAMDRLPGGYLLPSRMKSLTPGNDVQILFNGENFFPSVIEALRGARESIYMDFYRINDDRVGNLLGEILSEKAKNGVEVSVIYDYIGSYASDEYFKWLNSAGVRTAVFNPASLLLSMIGFNRRDHRKLVVMDGNVGFLGGLNIADRYGDPEKGWQGWRDTAVKASGPVTRQMVSIFQRSWRRLKEFPLEHAMRYMHEGVEGKQPESGVHAAVVGTEKIRGRRQIIKAYRKALWRAKRSIYIQSGYFIPPLTTRIALRRAALRGINVKVIVPQHGDVAMAHYASHATFRRLMKDGVKIYEMPGPFMHAKTAVIDGVWSTVGSYNQNHRSFFHDLETALLVLDEDFGTRMEKSFAEDLKKTIPVDPRKWKARPLNEKIIERFCYMLHHWL
ncbi:MAG: phosphatidylserine/phosphatidylglycerophosphate/cardiolipin synthase family protein [Pseudomonadota bacterium]